MFKTKPSIFCRKYREKHKYENVEKILEIFPLFWNDKNARNQMKRFEN